MTSNITASPGDITIHQVNITPAITGNPVNIINQIYSINIYESIFSPTLYAEFLIFDPIDLINSLPIRGEEIIDISFLIPGSDHTTSYQFAVVQPAQAYSTNQDKAKLYLLRCVTKDHITNAKQKISKKFIQDSDTIIQNILTNQLKTSKKLYSESTKGIQDILISKMFPFQAIDLIRRRSVSKNSLSSSFCFFENQNGYNFFTIESLMQNNSKNIGNKQFTYDTAALQDIKNSNLRNILGLKFLNHGNSLQTITSGAFNNHVRKFDIFTKKLTDVNYINSQKQNGFDWADSSSFPWNSKAFESQNNDKSPQYFFIPTDSSKSENYIQDSIGPQLAYTQQLMQNITQIYTWGDNSILAGDVITATLPENTGFTGNIDIAKLVSGNFLVSKIRHIIQTKQNTVYNMSMELLKGRILTNI